MGENQVVRSERITSYKKPRSRISTVKKASKAAKTNNAIRVELTSTQKVLLSQFNFIDRTDRN